MSRITDFREILRYVPDFRGRVFVIAIDGEIIAHPNFSNILLDVALLHNLNIRVVIVHGASFQLRQLAARFEQPISNDDGTGVTDADTLDLALTAGNRVTHEVLRGLASVDLPAVYPNTIVARPAGILKGIDMQLTGSVERIDITSLRQFLEHRLIPVLPPLGFDDTQTYRLNSDALAVEVACALQATKLVYVTSRDGIHDSGTLIRQLTVAESRRMLRDADCPVPQDMVSKLEHACQACARGVQRVHIINGFTAEGLLAEVFSNEGVGTLIYDDEYEVIRVASPKDVPAIMKLIHEAAEKDEVVSVTSTSVEQQIKHFFVVEIDRNPVACAALHPYPDEGKAELGSVVVGAGHENFGIGQRMIQRLEVIARQQGFRELFCLSTQAFTYFRNKCGFVDATADELPEARRQQWSASGRNSRILKKPLA